MTKLKLPKIKLKFVLIGIALSLIVQCSIYMYLDKYRYAEEDTFKIEKIEVAEEKEEKIDIPIPSDAKDVQLSYDGKHMSYFIDSEFKIVNTLTGDVTFSEDKEGKCFYKWVSDSNRLFIAEKDSRNRKIDFFSYDVKNNKKSEVTNSQTNEPICINLNDRESKVKDIKLSTLTNAIYVDVEDSNKRNSVYRIDINVNLDRIKLKSSLIGNINVLNRNDVLVYENIANETPIVYILDKEEDEVSKKIIIKNFENPRLLNIDNDDNIYIGERQDDNITKLFITTKDNESNKVTYITLKEPVDYRNLIITNDGKIYVNNTVNNTLREETSGKEIKYEGTIIKINNDELLLNNGGNLVKQSINELYESQKDTLKE